MRRVVRLVKAAPVTSAYVGGVAAVAAVMELLGSDRADRIARAASTNLVQLRRAPVRVLPASAFVLEDRSHVLALPGLALTLGTLERWQGSRAAAGTFAAGHVGATLLVAAGLAGGITRGVVDPVHRDAVDVGISYGAWSVWGALTPALPARLRPLHVVGWTGALVHGLLRRRSFTDAGHLAAWGIGLGIAAGLATADAAAPPARRGQRATRWRAR